MGGVINILIKHRCCIHDSTFNNENSSEEERFENVETQALGLGAKAIEKANSFMTTINDISPVRVNTNH